jgi:hypothetical protein
MQPLKNPKAFRRIHCDGSPSRFMMAIMKGKR